mmetsp:Transcript_44482/g.117630  ORF Transcript_44482/g.117630 Transcript_44482/m.117630 type:complete len:205 (-) Transcript_44482:99-713(-)
MASVGLPSHTETRMITTEVSAPTTAPMKIMGASGPTARPLATAKAVPTARTSRCFQVNPCLRSTPFSNAMMAGVPPDAQSGIQNTTPRAAKNTSTADNPVFTAQAQPTPLLSKTFSPTFTRASAMSSETSFTATQSTAVTAPMQMGARYLIMAETSFDLFRLWSFQNTGRGCAKCRDSKLNAFSGFSGPCTCRCLRGRKFPSTY